VKRSFSALLLLLTFAAKAAPAHAAELSAGYSGLRQGGDLVHGMTLGAAWPRRSGSLLLLVEASGQDGLSAGDSLRELGLMAGAAAAPWRDRRLSPFVSLKGGIARARRQVEVFGVAIGPDGVCNGGCPSATGPAAEIGGGLDLRIHGRWAVRIAEADYRVRRLAGRTERGVRFGVGLVRR
jgi:hypothetical protein